MSSDRKWTSRKVSATIGLTIVLALSPIEAGTVWAGINEWTSLGLPEIDRLIIDPQDSNTVYATNSPAGILKSTNGGANWRTVTVGLPTSSVYSLAIDPQNSSTLYAGIGNRLFKSADAGESWGVTGLSDAIIIALAIDPQDRSTVYASAFTHGQCNSNAYCGVAIYKSTDEGTSWVNLAPFTDRSIHVLAIDPKHHSTVYAGEGGIDSNGGLYKSIDGGTSWTEMLRYGGCNFAILIDSQDFGTVYAGTWGCEGQYYGGVLKSTNAGASWNTANSGLPVTMWGGVTSLVVDPDRPQIIYAGLSPYFSTDPAGVFRSVDGGASWMSFSSGLQDLNVRTLALARGTPDIIYAGTLGGIFKITDSSLLATNVSLDPASTRLSGSFTATFSGVGLTDETYFDVRFRSPGSSTDQVALNWQQGISATHGVAMGTAAGTWTITGVRAHQDVNDHNTDYVLNSAILTVSPLPVMDVRLDP